MRRAWPIKKAWRDVSRVDRAKRGCRGEAMKGFMCIVKITDELYEKFLGPSTEGSEPQLAIFLEASDEDDARDRAQIFLRLFDMPTGTAHELVAGMTVTPYDDMVDGDANPWAKWGRDAPE